MLTFILRGVSRPGCAWTSAFMTLETVEGRRKTQGGTNPEAWRGPTQAAGTTSTTGKTAPPSASFEPKCGHCLFPASSPGVRAARTTPSRPPAHPLLAPNPKQASRFTLGPQRDGLPEAWKKEVQILSRNTVFPLSSKQSHI